MKAIVIKEFADRPQFDFVERGDLSPQAQEVKISVKAIGVNQADLLQSKGHYPAPPGFPADIPGLEFAGVVSELGLGVQNLKVGDRVFGLIGGGAYAQELIIHSQCVAKMLDDLDFVDAAALPEAFITAYDALISQMKLNMGESLLINAIGSGVGLAALQMAKTMGCFVIGTSRSSAKLDKAKNLGLDCGLVVRDGKFADSVKNILPNGVNVVLELVGGDYLIEDVDCCAIEGRISLIGLLAGRSTKVDLSKVLSKRLIIKGTTLRARPLAEKIIANQLLEKNILPLLKAKKIKPMIDKTFRLTDAAAALKYLASSDHFGKLVLTVD